MIGIRVCQNSKQYFFQSLKAESLIYTYVSGSVICIRDIQVSSKKWNFWTCSFFALINDIWKKCVNKGIFLFWQNKFRCGMAFFIFRLLIFDDEFYSFRVTVFALWLENIFLFHLELFLFSIVTFARIEKGAFSQLRF